RDAVGGRDGAAGLRAARVPVLPSRRRPGARPLARRHLRHHGPAPGRPDRGGRRRLHPRVDPQSAGEDRRRLSAPHADVSGARQRGDGDAADRLSEDAASGAGKGTMSAVASRARTHYLNVDYGVRSWLLTVDHKRIALLYLRAVTLMFFVGGIFAVLIRLELLTPSGDLVQADTYNKLFTMHGVVMVFFFLIPAIPAVLGNFLIPLMIGARDLAFPRLNLLSWYIYMTGAL